MKTSIRQLKRLISEALRDEGNVVWGTEEELDQAISHMDPDTVSEKDYTDSDTGEIHLLKGRAARTSRLHPQYAKDVEAKNAAREAALNAEEEQWEREDAEWQAELDAKLEKDREQARADFESAVKNFAESAKGYSADLTNDDVTAADVAPDMAENFFYQYPDWKRWARFLDMDRTDMKSYVADMAYEAMIS